MGIHRKLIYLSIPVLITGIFLAFLIVFDTRQPPAWQAKLDQYIVYKEHDRAASISVQAMDHASRPWMFAQEPGDLVFDHLEYVQTTGTPFLSGGSVYKPLAYPPQDIWCILLKVDQRSLPQGAAYEVAFAARFSDLYNAVWVIITSNEPVSSTPLRQRLSSIGCDAARLKGPTWLPDLWREAYLQPLLISSPVG